MISRDISVKTPHVCDFQSYDLTVSWILSSPGEPFQFVSTSFVFPSNGIFWLSYWFSRFSKIKNKPLSCLPWETWNLNPFLFCYKNPFKPSFLSHDGVCSKILLFSYRSHFLKECMFLFCLQQFVDVFECRFLTLWYMWVCLSTIY